MTTFSTLVFKLAYAICTLHIPFFTVDMFCPRICNYEKWTYRLINRLLVWSNEIILPPFDNLWSMFQVLQLVVLAVFGAVDLPLAICGHFWYVFKLGVAYEVDIMEVIIVI